MGKWNILRGCLNIWNLMGVFKQWSVLLLLSILAIIYIIFSVYFPIGPYHFGIKQEISTEVNAGLLNRPDKPATLKSGSVPSVTMVTKASQVKVTSAPPTQAPKPSIVNKTLLADAQEKDVLEWIRSYMNQLPNSTEVTLITAYFNLGRLHKSSPDGAYTPNLYKQWMSVFAYLDNPLIAFADTEEIAEHFRQLRSRFPPSRTTVIVIPRKEMWAFQLEDEIKRVYAQPGYPRHQPNTVNPQYSCAMHAKFEVVQKVIRERLHPTRYIAWIDIGLFRSEWRKNKTLHLTVPTNFDRTAVGYSKVSKFQNLTAKQIIWSNRVWLGGASFLAAADTAYVYCSEYRRAVRKLLDMNIMSTDQQVIYSMFEPSFDFKPRFKIKTYTKPGVNSWFALGYVMRMLRDITPVTSLVKLKKVIYSIFQPSFDFKLPFEIQIYINKGMDM